MRLALTRTAAIYIILILALAVGALVYLLTYPVAGNLNATGAVVVAASALVLSNKLWK